MRIGNARADRDGPPFFISVLIGSLLLLLVVSILGCSGGSAASPKTSEGASTATPQAAAEAASEGTPNPLVRPTAAPGRLAAALPNTDLTVGTNRFLIALFDDQNRPISDAQVELRFFSLAGDQATLRSEAPAVFRRSGDKVIYVAQAQFDWPGQWGVEALARRGQDEKAVRAQFDVRAQSRTPEIGTAAPRSQTKTATVPADIALICSADPVDDMHSLTIEQAVTSGKPSVILFGTPAYCTSQTCGPALEAVQAVEAKYRDRANFVHVEIYEGLSPGPLVQAVNDWNLPSDPWVFVVDREGKVSAKFETMISAEELEPAVAQVVG